MSAATKKQMLKAIADWQAASEALAAAKAEEMRLRRYIVAQSFPTLKEGANTVEGGGYVIKVTASVDRKVDTAALSTLDSDLRKLKVPMDALIDYKPELSLSAYRLLTPEQRKYFDRVLTIRDTSETTPKLVITPAK